MSLDPQRMAALIAAHGRIARVVVASVQGSAPREPGAAVLVWDEDQDGTIGGGALEYRAVSTARQALLASQALPPTDHQADVPDALAPLAADTALRIPLGPALGQCCGGAVTLLTEFWDADRLARLTGDFFARPLPPPGPQIPAMAQMPPKLARRLEALRNGSRLPQTELIAGWLIEPVRPAGRPLWIWGAGHVGRALVSVLAPLPGFQITWCDTSEDRFPESLPPVIRPLARTDLPAAAHLAPPVALHLILTYSHEIDLALCHALLSHGFSWCGLIGSATKWARFRTRLRQLGHQPAVIDRITCPIGQKSYGKHPQAIAIGVAADLLWAPATPAATKDIAG